MKQWVRVCSRVLAALPSSAFTLGLSGDIRLNSPLMRRSMPRSTSSATPRTLNIRCSSRPQRRHLPPLRQQMAGVSKLRRNAGATSRRTTRACFAITQQTITRTLRHPLVDASTEPLTPGSANYTLLLDHAGVRARAAPAPVVQAPTTSAARSNVNRPATACSDGCHLKPVVYRGGASCYALIAAVAETLSGIASRDRFCQSRPSGRWSACIATARRSTAR